MGASKALRTRLLSSQRSFNKYIFYDQKKLFLQNEYIFKKDLYFICNTNIFCIKIYFQMIYIYFTFSFIFFSVKNVFFSKKKIQHKLFFHIKRFFLQIMFIFISFATNEQPHTRASFLIQLQARASNFI